MLPNRLFGFDSLRGTLRLYAVVLVCLPLVLSLAFFAMFDRSRILESQKQTMLESLRLEKIVILDCFENIFSDIEFLSDQATKQNIDLVTMRAMFEDYKKTHHNMPNLVFANTSGHVVVELNEGKSYIGDRKYFEEARKGQRYISDLLISRRTGTELVTLSVPVKYADGHFAGVIFMPFELSTLDHLLNYAPVGRDGQLYLADVAGRILAPARTLAAQQNKDQPGELTRQLIESRGQGGDFRDEAGQDWEGVAIPLVENRWYLVQRRPVSAVLDGYYRQIGLMALGAITSILLIMPLLVRLARNLERPLERLLRFSQELLTNRSAAISGQCPVEPMPAEMRSLYRAFCDMAREVRTHIEEADRLSIQDHLTGLYNRRFLFDGGAKLLEAAARSERPCTCLMIDVDHFKRVNDSHGHTAGDRVLAHVADRIASCVRKSDLVARYGGEEFVVLLTGAGREEGLVLARRLRQTLAEQPCVVDGRALSVTVSIGVAQARQEVEFGGSMLDDLLARADQAMYLAKESGRDRVETEGV
jgi:two-component system, cell cycle response regulator